MVLQVSFSVVHSLHTPPVGQQHAWFSIESPLEVLERIRLHSIPISLKNILKYSLQEPINARSFFLLFFLLTF